MKNQEYRQSIVSINSPLVKLDCLLNFIDPHTVVTRELRVAVAEGMSSEEGDGISPAFREVHLIDKCLLHLVAATGGR